MSKSLLATAILACALPLAAMAQSGPAPSRPPETGAAATRGRDAGHMRGRGAEITPEQRTERTERHLTELRSTLRITPAQAPQWDNFATATRENAAELHARFAQRGAQMQQFNAAQNMADYAEISALHSRELARLATSFGALYATFTPEQQRDADSHFRTRRAPGNSPAG